MSNEMMINGRKVRLYDSMYDYVSDADFTHYSISYGKTIPTPFVKPIRPVEDPDFMVWPEDTLEYWGLEYTRVNFGEDDDPDEYGNSFILTGCLSEEVYLIFVEKEAGTSVYVPQNGHIYEQKDTVEIEEDQEE